MASNLEKGNRFFDIMHRTNSDLIDILSGIVGIKIGEPETGILYIQDVGEKKAGNCYIDKLTSKLHYCTRSTNKTSVTIENFEEKTIYEIYTWKWEGNCIDRHVTHHYLGPALGDDQKRIYIEIDFEAGDVIDLELRYVDYTDPIAINQINIVNYFYTSNSYEFGTIGYDRITCTEDRSSYIGNIWYKIDPAQMKMFILMNKVDNGNFYFKTLYLTLYARNTGTKIKNVKYMTESEASGLGINKSLRLVRLR